MEKEKTAAPKRDFYKCFMKASLADLEERLIRSQTREERAFYRNLLNLKLQLEQEKVIGEELV